MEANKIESIQEIIEEIDNTLFMAKGPTSSHIPCNIHLEGCIGTLELTKEKLEKIIEEIK